LCFEIRSPFMCGLTWPQSSCLCIPTYLGWQACTVIPSHWWWWGLENFFS
jgi:hypothetical protein